MPGAGLDPNQDRVVRRLAFLQSRGEFETVRRDDSIVVVGGGDQSGRIALARLQVVQGRIRVKRPELLGVFGRAIIVNLLKRNISITPTAGSAAP